MLFATVLASALLAALPLQAAPVDIAKNVDVTSSSAEVFVPRNDTMEFSRLVSQEKRATKKPSKEPPCEVPVKKLIAEGVVFDQRLTPWQMEHCACVRFLDDVCFWMKPMWECDDPDQD